MQRLDELKPSSAPSRCHLAAPFALLATYRELVVVADGATSCSYERRNQVVECATRIVDAFSKDQAPFAAYRRNAVEGSGVRVFEGYSGDRNVT